MLYPKFVANTLKPTVDLNLPLVVDLFAGCGGLSLGFEACGFRTVGYEMNEYASETYRKNLNGDCETARLSIGHDYPLDADIVIGGPPCQPFSVRGKQLGLIDERNGFPVFLDAINRIQPKIFMFENVRGMFYKNKEYLDEILLEIKKMGYQYKLALLNAKDYLVPQNRERVVVVGSLENFEFPEPANKLISAGDAVSDLIHLPADPKLTLTDSMNQYIKKYEIASNCITPRDLHLDRPARTLTCRNLAGATSDMHRIKKSDGTRRMLTIRESARLQSFPDWFEFTGPESEQYKQIGNAVAPMFSFAIATRFKEYLENGHIPRGKYSIPEQQELFA